MVLSTHEPMSALRRINQHGVPFLLAFALFALCTLFHQLALAGMEASGNMFPVMDSRTIHNMALIDFINSHLPWIVLYLGLFLGSLFYLEWRGNYKFAWVVWLILAMPCIVYLLVCLRISTKIYFHLRF
jgi:hypothetical protein